jgi:hypothetical protein
MTYPADTEVDVRPNWKSSHRAESLTGKQRG